MAKTLAPVVSVNLVDSKSALKSGTSANVHLNGVPSSFHLLQDKPALAVTPPAVSLPPLPEGVRVVTLVEYKQAAACLAEAFAEDDVARYFIDVPDRAHWTEQEKWDLHVEILEYVTYAHILKGLVTTVGDFEAVALWLPPGKIMDDLLTICRSGMWRLNYRLSAEARRRFFAEFLPLLHDTKLSTLGPQRDAASWYLVYIGTRPTGRGKGHARRLIEHVTDLADREGRVVYLESSNKVNPPIYRKFGFEGVRTVYLMRAEENVELDIMVREPRG